MDSFCIFAAYNIIYQRYDKEHQPIYCVRQDSRCIIL